MYIHICIYAAYVAAIFQLSAALCRFDPQIVELGIVVISAFNDSLNACSQLSGLPNSLTFNDIVMFNASSVDFSFPPNYITMCIILYPIYMYMYI